MNAEFIRNLIRILQILRQEFWPQKKKKQMTVHFCQESEQTSAHIETRILTAKSEKTVDRRIRHKSEQNSAHIKTNILTWKEEKTDEKVSELKSRKK